MKIKINYKKNQSNQFGYASTLSILFFPFYSLSLFFIHLYMLLFPLCILVGWCMTGTFLLHTMYTHQNKLKSMMEKSNPCFASRDSLRTFWQSKILFSIKCSFWFMYRICKKKTGRKKKICERATWSMLIPSIKLCTNKK